MIEITIVRHGETDSNVKGTYLGWTDVELNENGLNQAQIAKEKLKDEVFDFIFVSPLKRTLKTAQIINETHKLDIILDNRLKERNFGVWDNLTYDEIVSKYPKEHDQWTLDWKNFRVLQGESSVDAYERITSFADMITKEYTNKKILIVTHLGCARKLISYLLGMGLDGSWHFKVDNASLCKITVNDENYSYLTALNQ